MWSQTIDILHIIVEHAKVNMIYITLPICRPKSVRLSLFIFAWFMVIHTWEGKKEENQEKRAYVADKYFTRNLPPSPCIFYIIFIPFFFYSSFLFLLYHITYMSNKFPAYTVLFRWFSTEKGEKKLSQGGELTISFVSISELHWRSAHRWHIYYFSPKKFFFFSFFSLV